jgi:micrococcal nuclease
MNFKAALVLVFLGSCVDRSEGSPPDTQTASRSGINARVSCTISRIADGDSVVCDPLGRVRLLLIDAPELSDGIIGRSARAQLSTLMPVGTRVIAETDVRVRDQFGRELAYLFLANGAMVNEQMAKTGYATTLVYPPNVKYVERIRAAVAEARKLKRGLWATGGFDCSPRDYRAGRCR